MISKIGLALLFPVLPLSMAATMQGQEGENEVPPAACEGCGSYSDVIAEPDGAGRSVLITGGSFTHGVCTEECQTEKQCSHTANISVTVPAGESLDDDAGTPCKAGPAAGFAYQTYSYTGNCGMHGAVHFRWYSNATCAGAFVADSAVVWLGCHHCE